MIFQMENFESSYRFDAFDVDLGSCIVSVTYLLTHQEKNLMDVYEQS
jgi:hypothetical protein